MLRFFPLLDVDFHHAILASLPNLTYSPRYALLSVASRGGQALINPNIRTVDIRPGFPWGWGNMMSIPGAMLVLLKEYRVDLSDLEGTDLRDR